MSARLRPGLTRYVFNALAPVVAGLVVAFGFLNYYAVRGDVLSSVGREIRLRAEQGAEGVAAFFAQRHEEALALAESTVINDYLTNLEYGLVQEAEANRRELELHLARLAHRSRAYVRITFRDKTGRAHASAGPDGVLPRDTRLVPLNEAPAPGQVARTPLDGAVGWRVVAGVFGRDRELRGHFALTIPSAALDGVLARAKVGEGATVALIDAWGRTLAGGTDEPDDALIGEAPVPASTWRLRLAARPGPFLARLRTMQVWLGVGSVLIAVLLLGWIGLRLEMAVRPLSAMAEATRVLARGELAARMVPQGVEELRLLADSFNEMAEALQLRNAELQRRLRELSGLRELEAAGTERVDEETLLRTLLQSAVRGIGFDRAALYWVDGTHGELVGRYLQSGVADGGEAALRRRRCSLFDGGLLAEAAGSRRPLLVRDAAAADPAFLRETGGPFVLAPVCGREKVFGVVAADAARSGRALEDSDRDSLMLFAQAAGLALENLSLFQTLAESEARYRAVLANSPVAVIGLSLKHHITIWNRGAESVFGWTAAEAIGRPVAALFPADAPEAKRLFSEVMDAGGVRDFSIPGQTRDGRRLDLALSWGGAHRDFWMNREWTVVIRDVTEERKLQQQLLSSEKLSAAGQMISGVAHELSNPLSAVIGNAQFALEDAKGDLADDLREVYENALRCKRIIENMLLFVRHGEVRKVPVALGEAIESSLGLLVERLRKGGGVTVRTELPAGLPKVVADAQQLEQVLVNLIGNACDAMAAQSPGTAEVRVSARALGGVVRVEVADTGPGLPPGAFERVFEPLFTTKPAGAGTGLGLAITRRIVQDHGGRIGAGNGAGGGAVFWFELPAAAGEGVRVPAGARKGARPRGRSILVVDDEAPIRKVLDRYLKGEGHSVRLAASVEGAFSAASEQRYDLVVCDARLGDGDGLTVFDAWEQRTSLPRPPFLFLTGDFLNEGLEAALRRRGIQVVHKPVELAVLGPAIAEALAGRPA